MFDNKWQKKEMPLVSLIGMGGGIASPAFLASIVLNILKPTVFSPADDTGVPDFDYTAESSAITNTSSLTTLDDFTHITSRTNNYEYIESDQNGSVFVTVDVSGGSYFEISQDGGATWSNSNTVTSSPWLSLRGHCFVDSPSYKGFIFGSYGPTGSGGDVPTFKSAQGNYLSWSQAGTIPSYSSSQGRYDEFATDNTGFIVAAGAYSNVAYSTDNADSWTRVSPGSGGTADSLPHWSTCSYFAKLGKFVITTSSKTSSGNRVYLSGDKSQVQSGNWTIHDSGIPDVYINGTATNDDYLFASSSSSVWRTSDLISWTQIADFSGTDITPNNIKVKGSIILLSETNTTGNTGDVIVSTDNGANWVYKKINSGDTFGSFDVAIDKDNNIVAVNDRKSPRVARTKLNATTTLTLTDTTVSRVSDGSLIEGESIDQVLTVGETVQADTAVASTVTTPVFTTTLWSGTGSAHEIVTGIDNTANTLLWTKSRNYTNHHRLYTPAVDSIIGYPSVLYSSASNGHGSYMSGDMSGFTANGFTVSADSNANTGALNSANLNYVAWNFRAAPGFLDIVTYTSQSGVSAIDHNLGSVPGCIIVKKLNSSASWQVYHKDLDSGKLLELDGSSQAVTRAGFPSAPTSTQFFIDPISNNTFGSVGDQFVAYLFADTSGLIKCGSYEGNGTSSGPVVETGFKPGFVLIKNADVSGEEWVIYDNTRDPSNPAGSMLVANNASVEYNGVGGSYPRNISFLSNGFQANEGNPINSSGTHIYIAIAENAESDITSDIYASGTVLASTGNTITLSDVSGTWSTGMKVQGTDSDTKDNPDPINVDDVSLTSSAPTAERNVSTWGDAVWEIATDENFTQNVQTATSALSATGTQAGPSFTLQPNTGYYTRTKYTALGQESEWSDVTYFVTTQNVYVDDVFSTYLYTGNGGTATINNGIDLSGEGGLVWFKNRSTTISHRLYDTERGATKRLISNFTDAETTGSNDLTAFNSNGFSIGNNGGVNANGSDYVSWTFRKAPGFFDVVTYTGDGVKGREIPHSLGSVPGMIIVKRTDSSRYWAVYHRSLGATKFLRLNEDFAEGTSNQLWSDTEPTSSVFTVHDDATVNISGASYVAYIFAHDDARFGTSGAESIIKCGSYTGDSSGSGNIIDLGFEPQWLMIKRISNTDPWILFDNMRGMANGDQDPRLEINTSDAEDVFAGVNVLPTGFELTSGTGFQNSSGETYIYVAIRRPHKPPTSAMDVFAIDTLGGTSPTPPGFNSGFPVDMGWFVNTASPGFIACTRLQGSKDLFPYLTNSEDSQSNRKFDYQNGWLDVNSVNSGYYSWMFRRAPGFFDVVTYTGNASTNNVSHTCKLSPS